MTAYVLGCGPSLKTHDLTPLKGEIVVACNNAAFTGVASHAMVLDDRWVDRFNDAAMLCTEIEWTYGRTNRNYRPPIPWKVADIVDEWDDPSGVIKSSNVGLPALQMASRLHPGRIVMLGFDMSGEDGKTANFHRDYPDEWKSGDGAYDRFLVHFRDRVPASVKSRTIVVGPSRLGEAGFRVVQGSTWNPSERTY